MTDTTLTEPEAAQAATALPLVLLVVADEALRGRVEQEAAARGLRIALAADHQDVAVQVGRERPTVGVVDLSIRGGSRALVEAVGAPVVALGATGDFSERVLAARSGAACYLDPGSSPSEVMDQVALAVERDAVRGSRVLLLDERPADRAAAVRMLEAGGVEVHALGSGDELWEALNRVNPSMLLLAEATAGVSGADLCRVLRNDPRWSAVPIVLLLDEHGEAAAAEAFAAGADDYVVRPLDGELAARAQSLLARHRVHQALAETDALTGLANRRTSTSRLSYMIRLAHRLKRPISVAEIDVDHFKQVNDRYGHLAGDVVLRALADLLRRSFRGEDVIARWGGEEFIVGMFGSDRNAAVDKVSDVLSEFRSLEFEADGVAFSVTFSAGVAQFPLDGANLEGLYRSADAALYTSKAKGRNQVTGASAGSAQQVVDVAVIEDDDSTAELIAHTLDRTGIRWWRFSNGASAAACLTGSSPELRARVALLDVNMPAFDGFEILALLGRDGVLDSTRVIMLTAMADDRDRERARDLGATAYITKPFDLDELLAAIRTAMGR